jgi:hypothetical protein
MPIKFYDKDLKEFDYATPWTSGQVDEAAAFGTIMYFLKKYQCEKKVCLVQHCYFDSAQVDTSDVDFLLVHCSDHPYNLPIFATNKKYLIVDAIFNSTNYWPSALLWSSFLANNENIDFVSSRKYTACCVNRRPALHRIYNTIKLWDYNRDKFKYVWYHINHLNGPIPDDNDILNLLGHDDFDHFKHIDQSSPLFYPRSEFILSSSLDDYQDSYFNIVSEARLEEKYITEKIIKPIRAGQLFLAQAPVGTIAFLRKIGFDVYDDYLDHGYDQIDNWIERTNQVHKEFDRVFPDIERIFFATTERRLKNLQVLRNFEKHDPWTQFVIDQINT